MLEERMLKAKLKSKEVRLAIVEAVRAFADHERVEWGSDRRGRWVVLEPSTGCRLANLSSQTQVLIDDVKHVLRPQRGRRFSSLSRARAFAREVGGVVRRWRKAMPGHRTWHLETNPWALAAALPQSATACERMPISEGLADSTLASAAVIFKVNQ